MFSASTLKLKKELQTASPGTVLNVQSPIDLSLCQPFHIVVKKPSRWFWQKPNYELLGFTLDNICLPLGNLSLKVDDVNLGVYNRTHVFKANGKMGLKLASSICDVSFGSSGLIRLFSKFGSLVEHKVNIDNLLEILSTKKLDMNHELLKQVRSEEGSVLCVVIAIVCSEKGGTLEYDVILSGNESLGLSKVASIEESAGISTNAEKTVNLLPNTPLLYVIRELVVQPDGKVSIALVSSIDGYLPSLDEDEPDSSARQKASSVELCFKPFSLLKAEEKSLMRKNLLSICATPELLSSVKTCVMSIGEGESVTFDVSTVSKKEKESSVKSLLISMGMKESDGSSVLQFDDDMELDTVAHCIYFLVASLDLIPDPVITSLPTLDTLASDLYYTLQGILRDGCMVDSESQVANVLRNEICQRILKHLQCQVGAKCVSLADNTIKYVYKIQNICRVLYGLWIV